MQQERLRASRSDGPAAIAHDINNAISPMWALLRKCWLETETDLSPQIPQHLGDDSASPPADCGAQLSRAMTEFYRQARAPVNSIAGRDKHVGAAGGWTWTARPLERYATAAGAIVIRDAH